MPSVLIRRRRQRIPAGLVEIDWSNPITNSLAFLNYTAIGNLDLVTRSLGTLTGTTLSDSDRGLGLSGNGSSIPLDYSSAFMATSNGIGTGAFTVIALADPDNSAMVAPVSQSGTGGHQMGIIANTDSSFAYVSGSVWFYQYSSGSGSAGCQVSGALTSTRRTHLFTGRRQASGTQHLFIDTAKYPLNSGSSSTFDVYSASAVGIGGLHGFTSFNGSNSRSLFTAGFNRALSDHEIESLVQNVSQLLKPTVFRSYFSVPAAATFNPAWNVAANTPVGPGARTN